MQCREEGGVAATRSSEQREHRTMQSCSSFLPWLPLALSLASVAAAAAAAAVGALPPAPALLASPRRAFRFLRFDGEDGTKDKEREGEERKAPARSKPKRKGAEGAPAAPMGRRHRPVEVAGARSGQSARIQEVNVSRTPSRSRPFLSGCTFRAKLAEPVTAAMVHGGRWPPRVHVLEVQTSHGAMPVAQISCSKL
ncbi:hypothetical protein AXG93_702s1180 [Marchantia polymorpha subsp. ruderalis]|uniref:Uncharacterized protein n=1 Tax=Marchantia polymorpha subsp. ruderalis TaxID=1480154 RepID=A0A176WBG3_MARPO|nr:hypothetical protein AXG93_702s1180 [Marchantia polymorpha subsp. ruderalis]